MSYSVVDIVSEINPIKGDRVFVGLFPSEQLVVGDCETRGGSVKAELFLGDCSMESI